MTLQEKYRFVVDYFEKTLPNPKTELHYETPFQLLIAVILSAQCTDKRINIVTPPLFRDYPTPEKLSRASYDDIYKLIQSVTYPESKTKYLIEMSGQLCDRFGGEIPSSIDELMTLKGVGRKTALVIATTLFNADVIPVDTHVFRVANRIGLTTDSKNVTQTEKILTLNFPAGLRGKAHHWLVLHGRYKCKALNPQCEDCGLRTICDYYCSR